MKKIHIVHLGIGNVGKQVVKLLALKKPMIKKQWGVELVYYGLFNSKKCHLRPSGFTRNQLLKISSEFSKNSREYGSYELFNVIEQLPQPFLIIDTTASDKTYSILLKSLQIGGFVVMSNKKPLSATQKDFDELHEYSSNLYYETTVGAALPVIQTLKNLIQTGDEVLEINACVSGTLGYIFSELDRGSRFSEAVKRAKEKGFTEPDPRDDLSGKDVARKALILARVLGKKMDFNEIKVDNLYPKSMDNLSVEDFMRQVEQLNSSYGNKLSLAKAKNKKLRFVAKVNGVVKAGVERVEEDGNFGSLQGPDNLFEFKTLRYNQHPLIIKGPGAGIEVTASGVISDILSALKTL